MSKNKGEDRGVTSGPAADESSLCPQAKPGDMLAELQGRLPIRVELKGLGAEEMYRILTEPDSNMIRQQQALLATEGVDLQFTDAALRALSQAAETANRLLDNIGARRLHTVLVRATDFQGSFACLKFLGDTCRKGSFLTSASRPRIDSKKPCRAGSSGTSIWWTRPRSPRSCSPC